jgi:hypothetical protein
MAALRRRLLRCSVRRLTSPRSGRWKRHRDIGPQPPPLHRAYAHQARRATGRVGELSQLPRVHVNALSKVAWGTAWQSAAALSDVRDPVGEGDKD